MDGYKNFRKYLKSICGSLDNKSFNKNLLSITFFIYFFKISTTDTKALS